MKIKLKVYNFAFICNGDHRETQCLKNISFLTAVQKKCLTFHSYMCYQVAVFSKQQINSPISFCADAVVSYGIIDAQLTSCGICCSNVCFLWHLWNGLYIKRSEVHDKNDRNIHFFVKMTDSIWKKKHSVAINAWKSYVIQKTCILFWILY